ncbi:MAG TPA: glycosyltransferase family 39 protein [Candidatus Omnitrophota bacterium]|nr:glycosyltransferase family 39 protein [Candidatus Omnitrophota bacterium]
MEKLKDTGTGLSSFQTAALFLILIAAFALRVWGISFGLPDLYHADEPIVVNHALAYGTGDLNPHFFKIPPLASYFLFGCFGCYYLIARLTGAIHGVGDFENLFLSDPSSFYFIGRLVLGAFLGVLTVYVFYRFLKKSFSIRHALLGALFLGVNFLHVRDSHYIYADIPLLLAMTAAFFPILNVLERGRLRDYALFGVWLGVCVAVKYNGVFVFVPFLAAHFLRERFRFSSFFSPAVFATGAISIAVFFLLNPFAFLDWGHFFNELFKQSGAEGFTGFLHHLTYSLTGALGLPLLILGFAGTAVSAFRRDPKRLIFISFLLAYYGVIVFFGQPYDRYVLPMIPFFIFFAADVLLELKSLFRLNGLVFGFLVGIAAAFPLAKSVLCDRLMAEPDVRTVSKEWVESHLAPGTRIALDVPFFMPRLKLSIGQLQKKRGLALQNGSSAQVRRVERMIALAGRDEGPRYELYYLGDPNRESFFFTSGKVPYDVRDLRDRGIEYVLIARISPDFHPAFYGSLAQSATLAARFSPYEDASRLWPVDRQPLTGAPFLMKDLLSRRRNGQIIEIYRLA